MTSKSNAHMRQPRISVRRLGVTLIEVVFSIGIILVGLVGLIAILPIAGRQARDTVGLNYGSALAASAYSQFESRGFADDSSWIIVTDTSRSASDNPATPGIDESAGNFTLQTPVFATFLDGVFPPASCTMRESVTEPFTSAFCVDPLMVANRIGYVAEPGGYFASFTLPGSGSPTNGYRRNRFPYYKAQCNPLADPSRSLVTTPANATQANAWPPMARMWRGTVDRNTTVAADLMTSAEAQLLMDDTDQPATFMTDDTSLYATMDAEQAVSNVPDSGGNPQSGLSYGKKETRGTYSWLATVNDLPGSTYKSVSIVVIENRNRGFATYVNGTVAGDPEANMEDERIAYVNFASGFNGGSGGTVEIVGSQTIKSSVKINDWVMLSRNTPAGQIHRWYRVTGAIGEPIETFGFADPVDNSYSHDVWQQRVTLDGPDWSFGFATPGFADSGSATAVSDNTIMTLVKGVVSVTERTR